MLRLNVLLVHCMWQEYSHPSNEFTFLDQHTGKTTVCQKHTLDVKPPQDFFVAESISSNFAYQLALQFLYSISE